MSLTKESFYFAPHDSLSNADMIKGGKSCLGFLTDNGGCIAIRKVTTNYLWNPDASNLINQKAPHVHTTMIPRDAINNLLLSYQMTRRHSGIKRSFYVELVRNCKGQKMVFGISRLYVEYRIYYEQAKRYFDLSRREQVKAKIFEEFVRYQERLTNKILALQWVDTMTAIRKRYNPCSVSCSSLSRSIFLFFSWHHARIVKLNKILTFFTHSIVQSLPEKIHFKRKEGARIKPEVVKFLEEIYYHCFLRLEKSLLPQSLPWSTVSTSINIRNEKNLAR
jgi:hypothetical protein